MADPAQVSVESRAWTIFGRFPRAWARRRGRAAGRVLLAVVPGAGRPARCSRQRRRSASAARERDPRNQGSLRALPCQSARTWGWREGWWASPPSEPTLRMPVPSSYNDRSQARRLRDHVCAVCCTGSSCRRQPRSFLAICRSTRRPANAAAAEGLVQQRRPAQRRPTVPHPHCLPRRHVRLFTAALHPPSE